MWPRRSHDATRSDDDEFDGPGSGSGGRLFRTAASSSAAGPGSSRLGPRSICGAAVAARVLRRAAASGYTRRTGSPPVAAASRSPRPGAVSLAALALGGGLRRRRSRQAARRRSPRAIRGVRPPVRSVRHRRRQARSATAGAVTPATVRGGPQQWRLSVSTTAHERLGCVHEGRRRLRLPPSCPLGGTVRAPGCTGAAGDRASAAARRFLRSPLTRSALPSITYDSYGSYDSYGTESQAGAPWGRSRAVRTTGSTPAPSPVTTAAPPHG